MNQIGSTTVTTLLKETEIESERTTGWIRIVLAVALAVSLLVSGRIAAAGYADIWGRLGLGALAIGALFALGIVSLVLVPIPLVRNYGRSCRAYFAEGSG
jgi:adenylate cyclase